jgi:DNA-binding transcriptional regulator GbsR (MarR family)
MSVDKKKPKNQEVEDAYEICDEIEELAEELADNDNAQEYVSSVLEKMSSMKAWIEKNDDVTEKMSSSLANMRSGLQRWIK